MDENREAIQIWGEERESALKRCLSRIAQWGLTMPAGVETLALDFGLGRFRETGLIEFWVANREAEGYCGKFLFVFDGQTCPSHHHGMKHETFFVMKGRVRMAVDGVSIECPEGEVVAMPPGTKHDFTGIGDALLLEVSQPCMVGDNYFADRMIGRDGRA
ncbi:MAG TPA: cupin domain-containing protein [Candidatus Brocadiia bacterium]|nr:cupin domain-containing protein [Candidatus Brocadiia bacterium]